MKIKIMSILCIIVLAFTTITQPTLADNVTQNSTPSTNTNVSDGEDFTQGEKTTYNNGTTLDTRESTEVYVSQSSTFAAMIPKVIILGGQNGLATYEVYAKGNIGGTENVYIVPQNEFQLHDVKNIKHSLNGLVTQEKTSFSWNDVMNEQKFTTQGTIFVNGITAGNWNGVFNFNIYLKDTIVPVEIIQLGDASLINSETNTIQVAYDQSTIVPIDIYPFNAGTLTEVFSDSPYVQVEIVDDTSTLGAKVDSSIFDKLLLLNDTFASDDKTTINVKVTLKEDAPPNIQTKLIVKAKTKTLEIPISAKNKIKFEYSGNVQEFVAPISGTYKLEVYGASGGSSSRLGIFCYGGKGGYSSGTTYLEKGQKVYIANGGSGGNYYADAASDIGGYNGGGELSFERHLSGAPGGGATSITTTNRGTLNNFDLYRNEVLVVAGGGGGANTRTQGYGYGSGGDGGGLIGGVGTTKGQDSDGLIYGYGYGSGGTQVNGGLRYWYTSKILRKTIETGLFGKAGNLLGVGNSDNKDYIYQAGGGGGWYGGGTALHGGGGGGSSYIDGVNNGTTTQGVNVGNGYTIITIVE